MLPLLEFLSDGAEHSMEQATEHIASRFELTPEEREERIPSGNSTYIKNRTGWARTYLKKAGLLCSPKRGHIQLTDRGRQALTEQPSRIDRTYLEQFPEFVEFQQKTNSRTDRKEVETIAPTTQTPEETIEAGYSQLRSQLADELLDLIKSCSSDFFERLVVDVIVAMGYGGSHRDAATATKKSHDGGIDGIIKQDRLGLDAIYIQAKKWEASIHRPEIQKFAGALQGVRARKGIFITTSSFSDGARDYVALIDSKIVLIDGIELAQLMIDHGIGVTLHQTYEIKRLDSDYFAD
jgi:restriction system protein